MTPKLSYCLNCKKDTETVLIRVRNENVPFLTHQRRLCKDCGKGKPRTELEME